MLSDHKKFESSSRLVGSVAQRQSNGLLTRRLMGSNPSALTKCIGSSDPMGVMPLDHCNMRLKAPKRGVFMSISPT